MEAVVVYFKCSHLQMSSAEQTGEKWTSLGLEVPSIQSGHKSPVFPFSVSVRILLSACLQSPHHGSHTANIREQVVEGGGSCVSVRRGGGAAHHAQQINEPEPICHTKAHNSQYICRGENNHLHLCWIVVVRLFFVRIMWAGGKGREKSEKGVMQTQEEIQELCVKMSIWVHF